MDPKLEEIVSRLIRAYAPERIDLLGSMERRTPGPDSDYDLLLVAPDDAPPECRRSRLACEVLRGTGIAVEVLVLPRDYFERRRQVPASLSATVEREGKLLHVA